MSTLALHGAEHMVFCSTHFHKALLCPYIKKIKMLHAFINEATAIFLTISRLQNDERATEFGGSRGVLSAVALLGGGKWWYSPPIGLKSMRNSMFLGVLRLIFAL